MKISTHPLLLFPFVFLFTFLSLSSRVASAQARSPAVDSMGANMGRQNWKAAFEWALKAAESDPADKYWRYLNAAHFASLDKNALSKTKKLLPGPPIHPIGRVPVCLGQARRFA